MNERTHPDRPAASVGFDCAVRTRGRRERARERERGGSSRNHERSPSRVQSAGYLSARQSRLAGARCSTASAASEESRCCESKGWADLRRFDANLLVPRETRVRDTCSLRRDPLLGPALGSCSVPAVQKWPLSRLALPASVSRSRTSSQLSLAGGLPREIPALEPQIFLQRIRLEFDRAA